MARYKIIDDNGISFTTHTCCGMAARYMDDNPVRKWFVEKSKCWLYSSARNDILNDDSVLRH